MLIDTNYLPETAACFYEDGEDEKVQALIDMMTDEEKVSFTEYVDDINAKWARAAAYKTPAKGTGLAARNAASWADAPDYEGAILARQGY